MNKKITARILSVAIAALGLAALAGCGGGSDPTATPLPPTATPTATPAPPTPTATPTPAPTAQPTNTTVSGGGDAQLIAAGKEVFDKTAGSVGCAYCHHADATGDVVIGSPDIRGVTEAQIVDALATRAQMAFITLTDDEIKAVAAYLQTLE